MTPNDLIELLTEHQEIEFSETDTHFYFRNVNLPWYQADENRALVVERKKMNDITPVDLLIEVNRGLQLEHISRVTGYFSKIGQWNKGKLGELRDRLKHDEYLRPIKKPADRVQT